MNNARMHTDPYMHNAFWYPDHITITFQFKPGVIPTTPEVIEVVQGNVPAGEGTVDREEPQRIFFPTFPTFNKARAIAALNVDGNESLNAFLSDHVYPTLSSIDFTETLRSPGATPPEDPNQIGKYLFTSLDEQRNYVPTVIGFFKFNPYRVPASIADSTSEMISVSGNGSTDNDHDGGDGRGDADIPPVIRLVNFINSNLDVLQHKMTDKDGKEYNVPIVSASPTWLVGSTGNSWPVGCPVSPPIPVPAGQGCSSSPGLWPITLPTLPRELECMTGDGVNIIILDTLPSQGDINRAVEGAGDNNLLLLDVANNVERLYKHLPREMDKPNSFQPKTGKDIKGRLSGGFRMADHGLFVAGIVRDIAPNAHVECIRILNDFCAGDATSFTKALESIHNRMLLNNPDDDGKQGDLYQKPVVLNLSLVIPDDKNVTDQGLHMLETARQGVLKVIQSLVDLGANIAASAGNEGDNRYKPSNPKNLRPKALYPAYFAYKGLVRHNDRLIPVGAVTKNGKPASYSCYPGDLGLATYGGDLPKNFKRDKSGCYTKAQDIDGMIGIYTSLSYPALLLEDCLPTYSIPNANAWAYWSGTSFATPIISALAARIFEYRLSNSGDPRTANAGVRQSLTNFGVFQQITWDRLEPDNSSKPGPMLLAQQCCTPRIKKKRATKKSTKREPEQELMAKSSRMESSPTAIVSVPASTES